VSRPRAETDSDTVDLVIEGADSPGGRSRQISLLVRPREWSRRRKALLTLASVVILIGLGMVGVIAYQLWGTGIATARHQAEFEMEFENRLALAASEAGTFDGFAAEGRPVFNDDPVVTAPPTPGVTTTTVAPPDIPGILHEVAPPEGEVLGRILIPEAGVDWMIVEGVGVADLAKGPGHMPWTALPGQPGNAVISGHRTTNGAPFYDLNELEPGDAIFIETLTGTHTYEVVADRIVPPTGVWVTEQWNGAWLTLTTCNPRYSAQQRLIVFAKLVDGPNAGAIQARIDVDYSPPEPPADR
jgi:sortase A